MAVLDESIVAAPSPEENFDMKKNVSVYPLRLPASLKAAVAEISREEGTSINQFVAMAVAE